MDKDTLVIFTSDNGPHNEDGQDPRFFDSWGMMDGIKRDLWEAGVREPTMVQLAAAMFPPVPSMINLSAFWDWMPTFADLAGLPPPGAIGRSFSSPDADGQGQQRSRGFLYFEYEYSGRPSPWTRK